MVLIHPLAFIILGFIVAFGGCAPRYRLVHTGEVRTVASVYTIQTPRSWSVIDKGEFELWTVDGPVLEAIRIYKGLNSGSPLFEEKSDRPTPVYHAGMKPHEIMELIVDSFGRAGLSQVNPHHLRPSPFGDRQGFRFELDFVLENGLEMLGLAVWTQVDDRLYLILYTGTRQHYYEKYLEDVEKLISSVRFIRNG